MGFSRVVTDYATFAWVCDLIVDNAHRGRGIGKAMLAKLHEHPRLQTLRRWCLATRRCAFAVRTDGLHARRSGELARTAAADERVEGVYF